MSVPNTFSLATGSIPLSQLDANFAYYDAAFQITGSAMSLTGAVTLSAGTANGVPYLNASKVLTSGSALTFDGTTFSNTTNAALAKVAGAVGWLSVGDNNTGAGALRLFGGSTQKGWQIGSNLTVANALEFSLATTAGGTTFTDQQMILTTTGLGIGTSSPGAKLDVSGVGRFGELASKISVGLNGDSISMNGDLYIQTSTANSLFLRTNGVLAATINPSGNLGLGVTPSAWLSSQKALEVSGWSVNAASVTSSVATNAYVNSGSSWIYKATGYATRYDNVSGQHQWYTAPSGTAGNAISFTQAMTLSASSELNIDSGTGGGRLTFTPGAANNTISSTTTGFGAYNILRYRGTQHQWLDSAGTQAMTLDASGNLFVAQTGRTEQNSNSFSFDVLAKSAYVNHANGTSSGNGYINFGYNAVNIGSISQNGTTGVLYNMVSDHRLKTVLGSITDSGSRIDALEPIEYEWKSDGSRTRGFLAHKFQEVYAGSVTGTKDAVDKDGKPVYQAMQAGSSEVIADLVAEIQSLRKRLAAAGI